MGICAGSGKNKWSLLFTIHLLATMIAISYVFVEHQFQKEEDLADSGTLIITGFWCTAPEIHHRRIEVVVILSWWIRGHRQDWKWCLQIPMMRNGLNQDIKCSGDRDCEGC